MNRLQTLTLRMKRVLTVLPAALLIGLCVLLSVLPQPVQANSSSVPEMIPSEGKRFWVTFLSNENGIAEEESKKVVQLVAASRKGATVTIHYSEGGTPQDETTVVAAGGQSTITIDKARAYNLTAGTNKHSVLVTSTDTIALFASVRDDSKFESTFVLPESALGSEYIVQNNRRNEPGFRSEFAVVATEPGTTKIHIKRREIFETTTPSYIDGIVDPVINLEQGQVYFYKAVQNFWDDEALEYYFANLTGTEIYAEGQKKIAVFQADEATITPFVSGYTYNYTVEQALPVSSWGKEFVVVRSDRASYEIVRITTAYPTTIIIRDKDGNEKTETLAAMSTLEYPFIALDEDFNSDNQVENLYITSDQPVMVSTLMPCKVKNSNRGAPAIAVVPPIRQGLKEVVIGTTNTANNSIAKFYANVVVPTSAVSAMQLDGIGISAKFSAFGSGIPYSYAKLDLGTEGYHRLTNANAAFIVTAYGHGSNNAYFYAAGFNNVPAAPIVKIDGQQVTYKPGDDFAELWYCNKHPGIEFSAIVDYPHTGVKWDLGEAGATSTDPTPTHQYALNVSGDDVTHHVKFYVYRESPLAGVKDTDSVWVKLTVHPAYYDTLKTKVAAKDLSYEWKYSSDHAFGLTGIHDKGKLDLSLFNGVGPGAATDDASSRVAPIIYGKTATGTHKWTKADVPEVTSIFDSLVYKTQKWDCDSIFYLQLEVVPDIIMPEENASVCQKEAFTWAGHHNSWNHLTQDGVAITTINTAAAGTFVIRDTMLSLVFPYPDSIHILNLTVYDKPMIKVADDHRKDSICEVNQPTWTVPYVANYADSLHYWLKPDSAYDATRREAGLRRTTETSFDISTMSSLPDGKYKLILQAFNTTTGCISVTDEVPLVIKNRPSLKVDNVAPQCWDETAPTFTFNYTPVDAAKITYWVDSVGGTPHKIASTTIDVDATKKFDIATTGWPAGHYELYAQPVSSLGCDSTAAKVEFVINKKPTISITSTLDELSQCDKEDATTLKFNVKDAINYNYYIKGKTSLLATPVAVTDGDKEISLDISSISGLTEDTEFMLKMVANSATCVSDTAEATFTIYPMPTATITSTASDLNACAPYALADNLTVNYTTTNTTQVKWELEQPGGTKVTHDYAAVGTSFSIPKAQLAAPGTYKVKITGVKSTHGCETEYPTGGEVTFKMYNPATVALGHIDSVCAGEHIRAPYSTEYADTYRYKVLQGSTEKFSLAVDSTAKATGTIIVPLLEDGEYKLVINATNEYGCGDGAKDTMTFTVNPLPTIENLKISNENVCENETTSCELTFTTSVTGNDTIIYSLTKGTTPWVSEKKILASAAGGKITLDQLDTLSTGVYTVTVTPKTAHGCSEAYATVGFTVHPQPDINLKNNDAFCYGSRTKLTVPYERKYNVKEFTYHLKPAGGGSDITSGKITSFGESFDIEEKIVDLPVGDYILYATALSDKNCTSENDTVTITVYEMPTAKIDTIYSQCDNAESTTVEYQTTVATKYKYKIDGVTEWSDEATAAASGSFTLDISSLNVGDEEKTYTLKFKAYTATCEIEAENDFKIYPLPVITVLADTVGCEGYDVMQVRYASTNASKYTYTLTGGGITPVSETKDAAASGYIPVNVTGLADGTYTLTVTAVSEHNCASATPVKTCTIILKPQPAITKLDPVDSVCVSLSSTILSTTCTYDGDKIRYEVLKEEDGGARTTKKDAETQTSTAISFDVKGWVPGKYVLKVTALSTYGDLDCGSTDEERVFLIHPKPAISSLTAEKVICEGATTAEFDYTISGAKSMTYALSGSTISGSKDNPTTGKISFDPSALKPGSYTLTVTAKSNYGCDSIKTASLVVNNRPNLKFNAVTAQCHPADEFVIKYTPDDVAKIYWTVDGKITTEKTHTVNAEDTLKITTTGWAAGEYTLRARPESALECDSLAEVVKFTIHPRPTVNATFTVEEDCQRATARVDFKHTNGSTVKYWIDGVEKSAVAINGTESAAWFDADIDGLAGGEHTISLQVISGTTPACESEATANTTFKIYPLPVITVLADTVGCEGYDVMQVRYASTNASKYTYTLTGGGITPVSETKDAAASGYIPVNVTGLADGTYTLTVTAVSEHNCASATPVKTCTIILKPQPAITKLDPVDSVCVSLSSTILSTTCTYDGDKIRYEVLKEEDGGARTTKKDAETQTSTAISFDVKGWVPGKYVLKVTALSTYGDLDCGSTDEERVFLIHPKPAISSLTAEKVICEGATTAEFDYTISGAKSMTYALSGSTISGSKDNPTTGKISFDPSALKPGSYTLTVTAKSNYGCDSIKTASLVVNNRPNLKFNAVTAQCHPADEFVIKYTPDDVAKIYWTVDGKITTEKTHTVNAEDTLKITTTGWAAGEYTLRARPESALECDSLAEVVKFTIHPRPTVNATFTVEEDCQRATARVDFKHTNGSTVKYWIDGVEKSAVAINGTESAAWFDADIDGLAGGEHTISLQVISGTTPACESEATANTTFKIYPIPTLTVHDTTAIYHQTTIDVRYTATDASGGTYTYTLNGPGIDPSDPRTGDGSAANGGYISVGTNGLNPGVYALSVTVTSANGCTKTDDATITIYDPTEITIDEPVSVDVCKGSTDPIEVNIHTTYADKYSYEVVVKGTTTHPADNYEGWAPITNMDDVPVDNTISIDISNWAAAKYTITVKAENTETHAEKTKTADFEIYAIPTVTLSTIPDSICEEVTTSHAIYMGGDANMTKATYSLQLSGEEKLSGDKQTLDGGNLVLSTGGLTDGTYTLYVTPFSDHGCQGTEKSMTLVVCNRPTIALADPANACENDPDYKVTITTASADAYTYAYNIYKVEGATETAKGNGNGYVSEGSMTVKITGLEAGTYRIKATTTTKAADGGCTSAVVQPADFVIYEKPEITKLSAAKPGVCEGAAITVSYTSSMDVKYSYKIVEKTTVNGSVDTYASSASFDVATTDLPAAGSPYTLELITETANGCKDTATVSFAIYPIPALTGAEPVKAEDVCFGDATTIVTCTPDANVSKCTYTLKLGDEPVTGFVDKEVTLDNEGKFTINTSSLGNESTTTTYTVEVTPYSTNECHPATPYSTTFKVNRLPALSDITLDAAAVCEGTAAMGATFAHTGATSYAWELRQQGSTTVLRSGNATGLVDATSAISIDLLAPSALEAGKTYDLKVVVKNDATDCEQTKTASFVIRKNPVVTLSPEGTHICQPVTEFKFSYTNEDNRATVFHYQVLKGTDVIVPMADKMDIGASGNWTLPFGAELLQGEYKIHVTPANANCTGEEKILTFHVDTVMPNVTNATICYGETFDWVVIGCDGITPDTLMRGLTATTHQLDTLFCEGECVKVYELNLTAYPENLISEEQYTLCAGETYAWRGQSISKAGTYEAFEPGGANGCDKVYRIVVDQIVPEQKSASQTVCYGEPVIFNGKTYTNLPVGPQTLLDTIKSAGDCDSVYLKLNLTVGQRYYDSIVVTECNKYVWAVNGNTYNHSGIYREEMATVDGCDSVCVLNLTINPSYEFNETYDILNTQLPFTVHEFTYTAAGTYDREFVSVAGCDSIYHITLNVHELQLPRDTTTAAICAGATYTWQGNNYTAGGWYSVTENDGVNDVAIHVLHLNVNPTYSDTTYVHSCGTYNWRGTDYSASGIYPVLLPSSCGCDSTVVLKLTVGAPTASTVNVTACQYEPTTVGNRTFVAMANTSFTETLTNAAGCDSVVTYNVTVTPRIYTSPEDMYSFCEGESYTWHGHTYDKPGTYYDSVADANGCTTIIHTLILTQKQAYHFEEDVEVSELALPYAWVGHKADTLLRTNGDYYDRWTSQVTGCDSIYHIHFHVNWVMRDTVQKQGCESVTWSVNGHSYTYTESGLYSDTLFTDAPANTQYDVIHFCDVTVHPAYHVVDPDVTICQDELPYIWRGQTYSDLTVGDNVRSINPKTVNGCDSTFTITIHVVKSFRDEQTYAACPSELPYLWHGQLLTVAGDYTDAHTSITGCDSTYVLHFSVKTVTEPDAENQIHCQGEQIQWHGLDFVANEPGEYAYYDWYVPNPECPDYQTYHLLNLTVGEVYDVDSALTEHVCQGQTFLWFNADRSVTQDNAHKLDDHTYVETFHYEEQTVLGCDSLSANLTLYMHLPYEKTLEDTTVCNSYDWDGLNITTTGDYDKVYPLHGLTCADSVLHRHFTVLYSETETITEDVCDSYYWDKTQQDYTESGTYVHSVPQMGGLCDKVYTLNLTVRKSVRDTVTINNWCHEFTWAASGTTYHTSTIDSVVYPGAASTGCDSIAYLRLTLVTDTVFHLPAVTACETYTWADGDGMTYTGSTTARYATTSVVTGCDSIVYLPITINHPVAVTHNLEGCRTLTWNDETFTASKTGYVQVFDCDSVVTLNVMIHQPDTIHHVLRACESLTWNNETYTYSQQAQQDFLCDSVVMLDITIDHNKVEDEYVTAWDSYTWEGDTYTTEGYNEYTKTLTSACGCDSVVTLHLTLNSSQSDEETQLACESFDWAWSGLTYTLSGDYEVKKRIDEGLPTERDSTRTLHLGIGHKKFKAETVTDVCDAYVWHGTEYLTSGTYTYEYTDTCEGNVDTLHLTLYHKSVPVELYDTACDVLTINGKSYFSNIDFTETLQTVHGCDSVVNYHLVIRHRQTKNISAQACGSYTWEGTTYTESGVYNKVLTGTNGCDSVVTLTLSIFPSYNHGFAAVGCGGHYVWDNRIYDAEGDYVWNYTSVSGCDSTVTMHLTMPAAVSSTLDTTVCDYIDWNGVRYTETGSYEAAFTSAVTGCDSIAKLHLNIAEHPAGEETVVEYTQAYVWGGQVYYQSGDYTRHIALDDGRCDSIATLHLTITDPLPLSYEFSATACDAYTWDSETFYESGVYVRNFPTLDDRDSIVKLTLTIHHDTTVYVSDKHCIPYTWNDQTITESGVYTQVLERASGCDSVVTMTFISCERFETSFTAEARDVYTWEGNTYTESGEYTRQFQSRQGCDSLVTMYLTVVKTVYATDNAEACTQYAWADSLFTQSTIHTHIFPAATGGDSVVTMTLIIHEPVRTELFDTVREPDCSNPAYTYPLPWAGGESVQRAGIYTTTLASAIGCDSIVTLHLSWCDVDPCVAETSYQTLTACDSVQYEGLWYKTTGSYPLHYTTDAVCDSVHVLRVEIQPVARALIDTTACDSMYWAVTDKWYYQSGYDYDTLVGGAANGCDSITVMHVVIGHAGEGTLDITSCDALTLNGETFKESGTYIQHLTTVTGCDSTLTINLTLSPAKDSTISGVACDDTVWNNVTYTASGFYPQVLQTAEGCDSVVTLNLIIFGSKDINYIDSIHCDSIVWGPDREGNDTVIYDDGIYTRTFLTAVGCDSMVTMDLRLLRHDLVIAPDTQACDSFVWNEKVYFESGTYNDTLVSSRTGCDSITTMFIQIDPTIYVEIEDSVPPPFYLWPTENDTIWESGDYVDTVPSFITGCDSITTLHLIMTDSIILDPQEPVRVDTFGYCPGDTMNFIYNLLKGHPTKYILIFDTVAPRVPDYSRDFMSVLDTTYLENHGQDSLFTVVIPEFCPAGVYCAHLQLFDDFSSSEVYDFCIRVNLKGAIVSMWTDVIAINNFKQEYFGYQWYRDDQLLPGATKQYYSDGEDLNGWYRAKVQLADSSWVFTCEEFFDLRTDSLELIAYPTPAPVGQPVTIKAMGILLEKLVGSRLTITNVQGVTIKEFTLEQNQRSVDVELSAGLYIATLVTGDADDRARTANVKFTVF